LDLKRGGGGHYAPLIPVADFSRQQIRKDLEPREIAHAKRVTSTEEPILGLHGWDASATVLAIPPSL
jgi:hypothetical protein